MSELVKQLRRTAETLRLWSAAVLRDDAENVTGDTLLYDAAADEIERLQEENTRVWFCFSKTQQFVEEQQAEIERLQAIVDKLPKTADGVPVVPTVDGVYGGEYRITERRVFLSMLGNWNTLPVECDATDDERTFPVPVSECYSTREAAEKAREQ